MIAQEYSVTDSIIHP